MPEKGFACQHQRGRGSPPLAPPLGELSAKLTERAHACLEDISAQRGGIAQRLPCKNFLNLLTKRHCETCF